MGWSALACVCRLDFSKRRRYMNIHVGNLSPEVTEEELRQEFTAFGEVASIAIIKDRYSGHSKGFAFIEMPVVSQGQAAVTGLKGKTLKDRTMDVTEAHDRGGRKSGSGSYGNKRGGGFNDRRRGR
jgi:RNA recognition motif-containing protein